MTKNKRKRQLPTISDFNGTAWGIPIPTSIETSRTTLSLGVAAAERFFNELTVPGIGGVRFLRQISWSLAGIFLAGPGRERSASRAAHGVEALASYLNKSNEECEEYPGRLRGKNKLPKTKFSFCMMKHPSNYVQVTFRQGTVAAVGHTGLGLTEAGSQFNSMKLTSSGKSLVESFLHQKIGNSTLKTKLINWMNGDNKKNPGESMAHCLAPWKGTKGEADIVDTCLRTPILHGVPQVPVDQNQRSCLLEIFDRLGSAGERLEYDKVMKGVRAKYPEIADRIELAESFRALTTVCRLAVHQIAGEMQRNNINAISLKKLANLEMIKSSVEKIKTEALKFASKNKPAFQHHQADELLKDMQVSRDEDLLRQLIGRDLYVCILNPQSEVMRGPGFSRAIRSWKTDERDTAEKELEECGKRDGLLHGRLWQLESLWGDILRVREQA